MSECPKQTEEIKTLLAEIREECYEKGYADSIKDHRQIIEKLQADYKKLHDIVKPLQIMYNSESKENEKLKEAIEWKQSGGLDKDGQMYLNRVADTEAKYLAENWKLKSENARYREALEKALHELRTKGSVSAFAVIEQALEGEK